MRVFAALIERYQRWTVGQNEAAASPTFLGLNQKTLSPYALGMSKISYLLLRKESRVS